MNPTQALVAIWLNVDPENTEEFRKWHNCEHSTDRMDGPGFRVGYRYNAVDAGAHHNILCTFEGDSLAAFESDYYRESRDNPSPWTQECMAFIKNAERAVYSLEVSIGEPHRYDSPHLYMVSPNPEGEEMKEEMLAWYREEHLDRLYEVEGMTRGARVSTRDLRHGRGDGGGRNTGDTDERAPHHRALRHGRPHHPHHGRLGGSRLRHPPKRRHAAQSQERGKRDVVARFCEVEAGVRGSV